jgi:2,3-bisphosphoglycerate-independent phosphoglycerate mutase
VSVLLFFIDGLGIGTRGAMNPLDSLEDVAPFAIFRNEEPQIINDGLLIRTDATLGVEGRPQSASGQTTILTGVNAPKLLGYHKQGFPNEELRNILKEHSIFLQLERLGIGPNVFANAYTPAFFETRPRWVSATTVAVEAANLQFRTLADLRGGFALYQDFTHKALVERGFDIETRTSEESAKILSNIVSKNRFTLYEYFITDKTGHEQDFEKAQIVLKNLALLIRCLLNEIRLDETTVILTSDHGNIEDLSTRNHTLNKVPTLVWGKGKKFVAGRVKSLADITPTIVQLLKQETENKR